MDDEFKLCWKNFQDNIATGFQNLYDRGDLVDVTLACDGKLLHAHKIVLAICSPYFQEIFTTNPCKHPIIILKDVHFHIMCELLEFMYQGVVNVKHTELQSFMKIGQLLHIKGLATNSSTESTISEKSQNKKDNTKELVSNLSAADPVTNTSTNIVDDVSNNSIPTASSSSLGSVMPSESSPLVLTHQQPKNSPSSMPLHDLQSNINLKRQATVSTVYPKKQIRRTASHSEQVCDQNNDAVEKPLTHEHSDDFFLPSIPHISMAEAKYDLSNVKREGEHNDASPLVSTSIRNSFGTSFGFDYDIYKTNSETNIASDFSNELHLANEGSKNFGNHMDIPPSNGSSLTMLSSTSLLHGSCVYNRNNTVATQQGMKTYWLCKSYRISMCRARCITHQGRVISATGVHNHAPHMRKGPHIIEQGMFHSDGTQTVMQQQQQEGPHTSNNNNPTSSPTTVATPHSVAFNSNLNTVGCFFNVRTPYHQISTMAPQLNQTSEQPLPVSPPSNFHPNNLSPPESTNLTTSQQHPSFLSSQCQAPFMPATSQSNNTQPNAMHNISILHHPANVHPATPQLTYIRENIRTVEQHFSVEIEASLRRNKSPSQPCKSNHCGNISRDMDQETSKLHEDAISEQDLDNSNTKLISKRKHSPSPEAQ